VWILWLFIGPLLAAVAAEGYWFMTSRVMIGTEAIVTQLLFEHSLRIRMKAETESQKTESSETTTETAGSSSPSADSADTSTIHVSEPTEQTVVTDESDTQANDTSKSAGTSATNAPSKSNNLVGKINNLVTSDLDALGMGSDFLFFVLQVPLQIALCIWFLYARLGWRLVSRLFDLQMLLCLLPWIVPLSG
jgi:hypothetical protein